MRKTLFTLFLGIICCQSAFPQGKETLSYDDDALCRFVELYETAEQPEPIAIMDMADQLNDMNCNMITAYLLYKSGEWTESIHYCNKCIAMKPLYFRAILLRGCAKLRIGLISQGWEDIIVTLDPDACRIGCHHEELDNLQKEALLNSALLLIDEHYYSIKKAITSNKNQ